MSCSSRTRGRFSQDLEVPDTAEGREDENSRLAENCIWSRRTLFLTLDSHVTQVESQNVSLENMNWRNFRLRTPNKAEDRWGVLLKEGSPLPNGKSEPLFQPSFWNAATRQGTGELSLINVSPPLRRHLYVLTLASSVAPPIDKCCPHTQYLWLYF